MKPGDLVRLKSEFIELYERTPLNVSDSSVGLILGDHTSFGLAVLFEGRVLSMFEYELEPLEPVQTRVGHGMIITGAGINPAPS